MYKWVYKASVGVTLQLIRNSVQVSDFVFEVRLFSRNFFSLLYTLPGWGRGGGALDAKMCRGANMLQGLLHLSGKD